MPDTSNTTPTPTPPNNQNLAYIRPTLFIGVGGTGMEVLLRLRRKILNNLWGIGSSKVRVDSLTAFPVAQFIHLDLDSGAVIDSGKAQAEDLQFSAVKFTEEEKIIEKLNVGQYTQTGHTGLFPNIKNWFPLDNNKIVSLNIDPTQGAGQIRAFSRLYFFDKYPIIRDKIKSKINNLEAALNYNDKLRRLGLTTQAGQYRIVVIGSLAGGTGSGCFLDMGWLARWLVEVPGKQAEVQLMMLLPSGYASANQVRTEANSYAALMELESAMRGNKGFVGQWNTYERPELATTPYSDVYLVDTGNLAKQKTNDIKDVYHMVSDTLFEDLSSADFATKKRTVAVNQAQHKITSFTALVDQEQFPNLRLEYSRKYSSFGQSILDTQQEARHDVKIYSWVAGMLKAFFGVNSESTNTAKIEQRDKFLSDYVWLEKVKFNAELNNLDNSIQLKFSSGDFFDFSLVDQLLNEKTGTLLAKVEEKIVSKIDAIKSLDLKDRAAEVRSALQDIERDVIKNENSTAETTEDRISKRRRELLEECKKSIKSQLYNYLDNKDFGGLEFVFTLIAQMKDIIEAQGNGYIANLQLNERRYKELKELVRHGEFEKLVRNLEETNGFAFFSNREKQSDTILGLLKTEMVNTFKFHLRAKAASEASKFLEELSNWLGKKTGVNSDGRAEWSGLAAEFQAGQKEVIVMLDTIEDTISILKADLTKDHATLIYVPTTEKQIEDPSATELRHWADEAFKDFGGSKQIFEMLKTKKAEILSKVRAKADLKLLEKEEEGVESDPLMDALTDMTENARKALFKKWIERGMPWVMANLEAHFQVQPDQYKCFIGVCDSDLFSHKFGKELIECIPTGSHMRGDALLFVTTGIAGKAVCYSELSGFPLTIITGIEQWRTSYKLESHETRPALHTHVDTTQFTHPIEQTPRDLVELAEQFKYYLLAVMTNICIKYDKVTIPPGQYRFFQSPGNMKTIGNERILRINGLPIDYAPDIKSQVDNLIESLDEYCLTLLSILASYYEWKVYTPKVVQDGNGVEYDRKGFANVLSKELSDDFRKKALQKGMSKEIFAELAEKLGSMENLKKWANVIPNSDKDAYEWEVQEPSETEAPRLKYAFKPELLESGKAKNIIETILAGAGKETVSSQQTGNSPTTVASSKTATIAQSIREIAQLKDEGMITEAEFNALKSDLMKKLIS